MNYFIRFFGVISLFGILSACNGDTNTSAIAGPTIIPEPQQFETRSGYFNLHAETTIYCENEFLSASDFLRKYLLKGSGIHLKESVKEGAAIIIEKDTSLPSEGYELDISEKTILIKASDASGAFYGIQSLRQLLSPDLERLNSLPKKTLKIPQVSIKDQPAFSYRGMHLDVGRHFFPKEFIKKYISYLAMLKMNYFHWHLTEDQGWRIEIKQYPKLTTHAAYRAETLIGHYNDTPQKFDGKRYGGFYTQEDIKEIVAYATEHHITIIPEIEMPGHAQAAISAYPELGCTGEQVSVATKWGVFENIYCPNEKTMVFLKNVLSEVIDLFPGEYIHIGGDEAPKIQWENCNHCQKLIKEHNLKDEHGLQSWFIKEIESFVNSKGKKIIGWDEILEGGLAPNATVMSWRGIQGGIEAAKAKHNVIMTPTSDAYFDYYQSEDPNEPLAIGGYLSLEKVYSFNPVPEELTEEEIQYILGAQGNVWTEYMKTEEQVEYMLFPRILAMSEVVWKGASKNVETDYPDFVSRVEKFHERLDVLNVNYANHLYTIKGKVVKKDTGIFFELKTPSSGKELKYLLPGKALKTYDGPFLINGPRTQIKAMVYKDGEKVSDTFVQDIVFHTGMYAQIKLNTPPHKTYNAGGVAALNNGIRGSETRYGDSEWLGFWGEDLEVVIDLKETIEIDWVSTTFYHAPGQWIYAPKKMRMSVSDDGIKYTFVEEIILDADKTLILAIFDISKLKTRYVKLEVPNFGKIPDGKQGAGNKAWTFIDEVIIQ